MRGGVVYRAHWRGVTYAALASPLLAATVGAAVSLGLISLAALLTGHSAESLQGRDWRELATYLMGFAVFAVLYASVFTYVTASPFMAAAWLTAHRLGWRGPRPMALVMGVGGMVYGAGLFGLFGWSSTWDTPVFAVLWIGGGGLAGLVSGLVTGAFISTRAYERIPPSSPAAPDGAV